MKRCVKYCFIALLLLGVLLQEAEARRKIVRGRKIVNRYYLRPLGLPAWVIVLLVGIGEIILGAIMYVIMKMGILDKPLQSRYVQAPTSPPEDVRNP